MNHCGECYYWELTSTLKQPSPSGKCNLDNSWGLHSGQMACRQFRKDKKKMSKQNNIEKICRNFQRKMQKIVDESKDITGISIEVGGVKTTIAEKKKDKQ